MISSVFADDIESQSKGTVTIAIDGHSATWPVWSCTKSIVAHESSEDSILEDPHIKLLDFTDVIQLVVKIGGNSYLADIPGKIDSHNVDYDGNATKIAPLSASSSTVDFSLQLKCEP